MSITPPTGTPPRRSRRPILIGGIAAVLLVLVLVAVIVATTGNNDTGSAQTDQRDKTAIQYVNAINTGDPATVCRLETDRQRGGDDQAKCEEGRKYLRGQNVKADDPKVVQSKQLADGTGVIVEYHLTTGGDKASHDALRMVQQPDGSWLVDESESADAAAMASGDPIGAVLGERRTP